MKTKFAVDIIGVEWFCVYSKMAPRDTGTTCFPPLGKFVERATDVDVVTDLMIHDIDIVLSLIKSELKTISATGTRVITDHVDIANARLEFFNGAVVNVTASRVSQISFAE